MPRKRVIMQIFCDNADYSKSDELRLALPLLLSEYHIDSSIDLNVELIPSPTATFLMHVAGAPAPLGTGRQQRHQADSRCALRTGPPWRAGTTGASASTHSRKICATPPYRGRIATPLGLHPRTGRPMTQATKGDKRKIMQLEFIIFDAQKERINPGH